MDTVKYKYIQGLTGSIFIINQMKTKTVMRQHHIKIDIFLTSERF